MSDSERQLASAVGGLPARVALSMQEALADGSVRIGAGSYDAGGRMCPLGAADAYAEAHGGDRLEGSATDPGYGGRLLRFAVSFDLCAERRGVEVALAVTRAALAARTGRLNGAAL